LIQTVQNTALVLFSRSARVEAANKCFVTHGKTANNLQVSQLLVRRAKAIGKQSGLPFFIVDETLQHGETFGGRLRNAVADVSALGYNKILLVGNDCPAITVRLLQQAALQLQTKSMVLGATQCGGAYLIGIDCKRFDAHLFENITWHTNAVYTQLATLCTNVFALPPLHEVNGFFDLLSLPNSFIYPPISKLAASLRASFMCVFNILRLSFTFNYARRLAGLRAPPLVVA